jgi:glycosyltransferase involved in cell wall biosynthesis
MKPLRHDLPPGGGTVASGTGAAADGSQDAPGAGPQPARALSVVVPMKDEEANVVALVTEICAAIGGDDEVVLVDDGSRDGTVREMQRARAQFGPRVRVIRHDRNRGQSTAICTGVRAAAGVLIATLDGDGQNDPADIPRLVQELRARAGDGVTMIAGERRVRHDSFVRRLSSRIANGVRDALLHDGVRDTGCGLKVFARSTFLELPAFDHMHRFLPALVNAAGGRVHPLPVSHRPRRAGRSKYGIGNRLWVGIVDLFGVRWLIRRQVAPHPGTEESE